jgi:hypothetical protein
VQQGDSYNSEDTRMVRKTTLGFVFVMFGAVWMLAADLRAVDTLGLKLPQPMIVSGVYLRPAIYDIRWDAQGAHATVIFSRKGRVVATVQGEISTLAQTASNTTLYFSKQPDGFFAINALGFAQTNRGIVFPVLRPRSRAANDNPAADPWLENDLRNNAQPRPQVYRRGP